MRPAFLVWAALLVTGSLALPVQDKNGRHTKRSSQFLPNAAFVGNFQGIPVFQQNPVFHHPVFQQNPSHFGQQAFGPVELVQFQNPGLLQSGNNQFFQAGNNQFQARTGFEQDAANLGLNQFQVDHFQQANIRVFPNSHEVDTSNLGLNPTKPTRVIVQTVPVVVEILDKTTNNNESELPGTVRTTSSLGAHRFSLGQQQEITEPVTEKKIQTPVPEPVTEKKIESPVPVELAKTLSQMISLLGSSSKVNNVGKSATTEQLNSNTDNLPVPDVLGSLVAIGTPPRSAVTVQTQKSSLLSQSKTTKAAVTTTGVTESTAAKIAVAEKTIFNQGNQKSFSVRTGEAQIPGAVAVDNMEMVLGMIGSSVVPNAQVAIPIASKQIATTTVTPVTEEPSAAEQIVLDITSRLSAQQPEKASNTVTPVTSNTPKSLSEQGIVTPIIMVLSPQSGAVQDISLNTQINNTQQEFVIVLDDVANFNNNPNPKKMNVGELALKIASESTVVDIPKFKVHSSAKNSVKSTNTEAVPITDPHVDVNQNLISKRLGAASNDDVGIEHIFLKSSPVTATDNLVPSTVDTEKNTTKDAAVDDIMNSLLNQMLVMVSPSGTMILVPTFNLTQEDLQATVDLLSTTEGQKIVAQASEPTTLATELTTTTTEVTAVPSTTTSPEITETPKVLAAPEILAAPEALIGMEKILEAMKAAQNNIAIAETPQIKSATPEEPVAVTPTEVANSANSTTLVTLENVIETMEAALIKVAAKNDTAVPAEVMSMIDEAISTMEASLVNVTTNKVAEMLPQTMKSLTQALTNMNNALEALQNVTASPQNVTASPLEGQQVQVVGQIVPNQGMIPQVRNQALVRNQAQAARAPQQEQVSIRQFMTVPIASSRAQSRSGSPTVLATNVADQVATILRTRISNGATRGAASQIPGNNGFNQRTGALAQSNQPISLADQLGSEIAHHLIAIF